MSTSAESPSPGLTRAEFARRAAQLATVASRLASESLNLPGQPGETMPVEDFARFFREVDDVLNRTLLADGRMVPAGAAATEAQA